MKLHLKQLVVSAAVALVASQAQAAVTVSCPGTLVANDREFSLTTDAASLCMAFGAGNISGNPGGANPDPFLTNPSFSGYSLVDKDPDSAVSPNEADFWITGEGSTSGSFLVAASLWSTYSALAIGFKSGEGQMDPDWAVFSLAAGTTGGDWRISGNQSLSHANLYGILKNTPPGGDMPEPGSVALVAAALLAIAATARRRREER